MLHVGHHIGRSQYIPDTLLSADITAPVHGMFDHNLFSIYVYQLLKKEEQLSKQEREFQQKEAEFQMAKRGLSETRGKLKALEQEHEESCRLNSDFEIER